MAVVYLLDANTLIDANRDYYRIGWVDEYWEWLVYFGERGRIKIPVEIYEELKAGSDALSSWAKQQQNETALKLAEEVDIDLVRRVTEEGYAADLTDIEIEEIGRDPFLIAYALVDPENRVIVTTEHSKPQAQGKNRKVPDVCYQFNIRSCNAFGFIRQLGFRTNWRDHL